MLNFNQDFSNVDLTPSLTEGKHVLTIKLVEPLKNTNGKFWFKIKLEKPGFKPTYHFIFLSNNAFSLKGIDNFLSANSINLEKRDYTEQEIWNLFKNTENKKVEAEIILKDQDYTNKEGKNVKGKFPVATVFMPVVEEQSVVSEDIELDLD